MSIAFGIGAFVVALGIAKDAFRESHRLPPIQSSFLGFTRTLPAPVSIEDLGVPMVSALVLGALIYAALLHPLIGRGVHWLAASLMRRVWTVFDFPGSVARWNPELALFFGAVWPITVFAVPVLLVALGIGLVYQSLWQTK